MKFELKWGLFLSVIIVISYILPFTVLSDVKTWYGSLFLWIFLSIIAIIANHFITKDWGNSE